MGWFWDDSSVLHVLYTLFLLLLHQLHLGSLALDSGGWGPLILSHYISYPHFIFLQQVQVAFFLPRKLGF